MGSELGNKNAASQLRSCHASHNLTLYAPRSNPKLETVVPGIRCPLPSGLYRLVYGWDILKALTMPAGERPPELVEQQVHEMLGKRFGSLQVLTAAGVNRHQQRL